MEPKERLVPWDLVASEHRPIVRMLPTDWIAEQEVTVRQPNGGTRTFRFDEVLAFRPPSEGVRRMLADLPNEVGCTTFRVEDSDWVNAFHGQTYGAFRERQIQHFVFLSDRIVEFLSANEPWIVETQSSSA